MSTKQHDETEVFDAGFTAADMATAAAQGFRDGQAAELAAMRATGEPVGYYYKFRNVFGCEVWSTNVPRNGQSVLEVQPLYTHPQPAAQDAERYQWLAPRLLAADFDYQNQGECVLVFEWPKDVAVGGDCSQNIDAARKQGANHD